MWLYFIVRPRKRFGPAFLLFCMSYAVARFAVEFLRADDRGEMFGLSTSQFVGIPLFLIGLVLYLKNRGRGIDMTGIEPELSEASDGVR